LFAQKPEQAMHHQPQATVFVGGRVLPEVAAQQRRLKDQLGCTFAELVTQAFEMLERSLARKRDDES
jgi:hypothetical protein